MLSRREFIMYVAALSSINLYAKENAKFDVKMIGELDDDLFINRNYYNSEAFDSIACYQMHNFTKRFQIGSKVVKSIQAPGYIKYEKKIPKNKKSIISIFTANEREDMHSDRKLTFRTHYKSVPLYINGVEFFPSALPEDDAVKDYPTWYMPDEDHSSNYYMLWENSVVFNGFITHEIGEHTILLFNNDNEVVSSSTVDIVDDEVNKFKFKKVLNKDITNNHIFTELDNYVFDGNQERENSFTIKNAVTKILIENSAGVISIDLPYPCPYINTYFIKYIKGA